MKMLRFRKMKLADPIPNRKLIPMVGKPVLQFTVEVHPHVIDGHVLPVSMMIPVGEVQDVIPNGSPAREDDQYFAFVFID